MAVRLLVSFDQSLQRRARANAARAVAQNARLAQQRVQAADAVASALQVRTATPR